jgi:OOP family OmpA-OmpF porin
MVPDQKTRERLLGIASQRFGARNVKDHLNIQSAAPSGWKQAAEAALTQLNAFDKGSAQIINNKMHITGSTSNVRTRIQIQSAIKNALPSDYQASFDIAVSDLAAAQSTTQRLSPAATFCQKQFDTLLDNGQHILFKVDSDIINKQSNRLLNQLVKAANDCSRARIEIGGHTDSQGRKAYNKQLSTRRAQAVIRYLTVHGISRNRLSAVGYGESSPIANNLSIEGRARNRRIQFKVIGN